MVETSQNQSFTDTNTGQIWRYAKIKIIKYGSLKKMKRTDFHSDELHTLSSSTLVKDKDVWNKIV